MNIDNYISSGIIESYTAGIASVEEAHNLLQLCKDYPAIKLALDDCAQLMNNFVVANAIKPPDGFREKIWEELVKEKLV